MPPRCIILLRAASVEDGGEADAPLSSMGNEEAAHAAHGLAAYLELPGASFAPRGDGEPCAVSVLHSGIARAEQTAASIAKILGDAGCSISGPTAEVGTLSAMANPDAAKTLLTGGTAPMQVVVGHLPLLQALAIAFGTTDLTTGASDRDAPTATSKVFAPGGGVLLEQREDGQWALAHHIGFNINWWCRGASRYVPAEKEVNTQ